MSAVNPVAYGYPTGTTTAYTADTGAGPVGQIAQNSTGQSGTQLADTQTAGGATGAQVAGDPAAGTQMAQAMKLAQSGAAEPSKDAKFLPLGVYSLAPQNQPDASAMVQLAVTKEGAVRGTYYDLVTDKEQPIQGAIDKETQRVAFTAGPDGKVVFENGATRPWTLSRYEKQDEAAATE
jgi:hypothetical protein